MIDPACKVCLGIGWVWENHPHRAWAEDLGCQCGAGMPSSVFELTASKSLTFVRYSMKHRQPEANVPVSLGQRAQL
jgi:hypothetical protein